MKRLAAVVLALGVLAGATVVAPFAGAAMTVEPADGLCSTTTGGLVKADTKSGGVAPAAIVTTADDVDCDDLAAGFDLFVKPMGGDWFSIGADRRIGYSSPFSVTGCGSCRVMLSASYGGGTGLVFRYEALSISGVKQGIVYGQVTVPVVQLVDPAAEMRVSWNRATGLMTVQPGGSAAVSATLSGYWFDRRPVDVVGGIEWGSIAAGSVAGLRVRAMTANNGTESLEGTFPESPDVFDESWVNSNLPDNLPIPDVSDQLNSWISGFGICDEEPSGWWTWIPLSDDFAGLACTLLSGWAGLIGNAIDFVLGLANPFIQVWWDLIRPVLTLLARIGQIIWSGLKSVWEALGAGLDIVWGVFGDDLMAAIQSLLLWTSNLVVSIKDAFMSVLWDQDTADAFRDTWEGSGGEWVTFVKAIPDKIQTSATGSGPCVTVGTATPCVGDLMSITLPSIIGTIIAALVVFFTSIEMVAIVATVLKA